MARSESTSTKKKAIELIESLPPESGWDEIMYEIYVRQKIEAGIHAANAGRVMAHDEVKKRFLGSR